MLTRCQSGHEYNTDFWPECPTCMPADTHIDRGVPKRTVVDSVGGPETGARGPSKTVILTGPNSKRLAGWVVVERGPQRDVDFRLRDGHNRIGRDPDVDIVLADPLVGSAHAVINFDGTRFEIIDLASKNGTFLNEGSSTVTRQELKHGDVIRVGDTSLKFIRYL